MAQHVPAEPADLLALMASMATESAAEHAAAGRVDAAGFWSQVAQNAERARKGLQPVRRAA